AADPSDRPVEPQPAPETDHVGPYRAPGVEPRLLTRRVPSAAMKVVVAHNRYRSAAPSGENRIVDTEIAQLRAAGVEVIPFLRESDDIPRLPVGQKAL